MRRQGPKQRHRAAKKWLPLACRISQGLRAFAGICPRLRGAICTEGALASSNWNGSQIEDGEARMKISARIANQQGKHNVVVDTDGREKQVAISTGGDG